MKTEDYRTTAEKFLMDLLSGQPITVQRTQFSDHSDVEDAFECSVITSFHTSTGYNYSALFSALLAAKASRLDALEVLLAEKTTAGLASLDGTTAKTASAAAVVKAKAAKATDLFGSELAHLFNGGEELISRYAIDIRFHQCAAYKATLSIEIMDLQMANARQSSLLLYTDSDGNEKRLVGRVDLLLLMRISDSGEHSLFVKDSKPQDSARILIDRILSNLMTQKQEERLKHPLSEAVGKYDELIKLFKHRWRLLGPTCEETDVSAPFRTHNQSISM